MSAVHRCLFVFFFFFNDTATTEIYTLSLHDALPILLKSLVSRAEIYDPETGEPRHPLLGRRPENNVLLIVVTGDKGLAGAFNTNILKAAMRFIGTKTDKRLEIETIGRKGRDFLRRRYRTAEPRTVESQEPAQITIVGEQIGIFNKIDYALAAELGERV